MAVNMTENKITVSAVIAAGGTGSRMGVGMNKIFLPISNRPVICRTLDIFEHSEVISEIIVVTGSGDINRLKALTEAAGYKKITAIIPGGTTRRESVLAGLYACQGDLVCIHDAARALLKPQALKQVVQDASLYGAAALGIPAKDTLKTAKNGFITGTVDRSRIYQIQTPQVFRLPEILALHKRAAEETEQEFTDDCSIGERYGLSIHITEGSPNNIKLTTPEDMLLAEAILALEERL